MSALGLKSTKKKDGEYVYDGSTRPTPDNFFRDFLKVVEEVIELKEFTNDVRLNSRAIEAHENKIKGLIDDIAFIKTSDVEAMEELKRGMSTFDADLDRLSSKISELQKLAEANRGLIGRSSGEINNELQKFKSEIEKLKDINASQDQKIIRYQGIVDTNLSSIEAYKVLLDNSKTSDAAINTKVSSNRTLIWIVGAVSITLSIINLFI